VVMMVMMMMTCKSKHTYLDTVSERIGNHKVRPHILPAFSMMNSTIAVVEG